MALLIRQARIEDVPTLCDLYLEFHEFHVAGIPDRLKSMGTPGRLDREKLARKVSALLTQADALLLVAEKGSILLGLTELYLREDDRGNPAVVSYRYLHVQSLIVTSTARRQGVGSTLLDAAEKWGAEEGAEEVRLDIWEFADGPLAFYERAGYRTLKRTLVRRLLS